MSKSYQSFGEFLKEHRLVREQHLNYYVDWVERFTKHCGNRLHNISRKSITSYLDSISRWKNIQDWQIRQADDAIQIFTKSYLKKIHGFDMIEQCRQHDIPTKPGIESWKKLLEDSKESIRIRHLAYSTEKTYLLWIRKFGEYLEHKAPIVVDSDDVRKYMTFLALLRNVAPSTQNQAFNAVLFLFRHVLYRDMEDLKDTPRPRRRENIPVVLSIDEIRRIFRHIDSKYLLIFSRA